MNDSLPNNNNNNNKYRNRKKKQQKKRILNRKEANILKKQRICKACIEHNLINSNKEAEGRKT